MEPSSSHATDRTRIRTQTIGTRRRQLPVARGIHATETDQEAYEQRSEVVQAWLDKQYPEIEIRVKAEGAEIHWGDEMILVNTDVRGHCYAPTGKMPVTYAVGGTRQKLSMIATVTKQGETRWMISDDAFNRQADRVSGSADQGRRKKRCS